MEGIDFSNASIDDFKIVSNDTNVETSVSQDVSSDTSSSVSQDVSNTSTESAAPVEPAVEQQVTEQVTQQESTPAEYSWKDDFIKGAVEYYEKTGDLTPYLQAKTIDFNQMSDEEIMRRNLREQYSELNDKAFDRLYKLEVTDKYKLDADEWGEDDSELGRELLKAEANKLRNGYLDWQKGFAAPEPQDQQPVDNGALEAIKQFEQQVRSSEATRSILDQKRISINTADGDFSFELSDPNAIVDMTFDNDRFFSQFGNGQGGLDYAKWYKTVAYSQNPEMFEKSLINYGKTLGRNEVTKEIKNPSTNSVGDVPTESSGDFMTGLLNAFASRGVHK